MLKIQSVDCIWRRMSYRNQILGTREIDTSILETRTHLFQKVKGLYQNAGPNLTIVQTHFGVLDVISMSFFILRLFISVIPQK